MLLTELFEAKIGNNNVGKATSNILSYLSKALGGKLHHIGTEHFKNTSGSGWGDRYVLDGSVLSIRFNWAGGKSAEVETVDVWTGKSSDPDFNISFKGVSLVKSLPTLANILKKPKIGSYAVEEALAEAKKGEFTPESAIADMISKLEAGRSFNRSEFVMHYHPENAHAYDEFVEKNADKLVISGKRISLPKGEKLSSKSAKSAGGSGLLEVRQGGHGEEYDVPALDEIEKEDKISFTDSLEHLEGLTTGLIRGSFNALFVAGRGGTGKTQTVEDTLEEHGLSDGSGFFKITGSASAIGIYSALYKNRDGIVLFDDCDGALDTQDGRNIIKAATDTKKIRKIAWGKKSAGMYDPEDEPQRDADAEGEDGEEVPDDRIPKHFQFTGRVIFISNLPLNKLDPDGALRTRAFIISIDPTPEEIFQRMEEIVHDIKLEGNLQLSKQERMKVLDVVKTSRRKNEASLRTLVRALGLAASGAPNWEKLVQLYA